MSRGASVPSTSRSRGVPMTVTTTTDAAMEDDTASNSTVSTSGGIPTPNSLDSGTTAAFSNITSESSKLLDAINKLELLGIDSRCVGNLPKIVAVGDQSAGKSSVIAAISGITVPRSSGTCTRCPSQIDLRAAPSPNNPWACTISIHSKFILDQQRQWQDLPIATEVEFAKIDKVEDLEDILRRAQHAILNPRTNPSIWLRPDVDMMEPSQVKFSPNIVKLHISGPNYPNLTFYDLPGIFHQTGDAKDRHLPREVHALVRKYITQENSLILLALPMNVDPEVSVAGNLVRREHAEHRTIGLLTKPDCIGAGSSLKPWLEILEGRSFTLGHGYFVTKQPNQEDLNRGMTPESARDAELKFFGKNGWSKGPMAMFQPRFGINNLQSMLSDLLVSAIRQSIPELHKQVDLKLHEIKKELQLFPIPPGDRAYGIVSNIFRDLRTSVENDMKGEIPHHTFLKQWRDQCNDFSKTLYHMRPTLLIRTQVELCEAKSRAKVSESFDSVGESKGQVFTIEDDSENEPPKSNSSRNKRPIQSRQEPVTPSPTKRQKTANPSFQRSTPGAHMRKEATYIISDSYTNLLAVETAFLPNRFSLETLRRIREDFNSSSISGTTDHRAAESIMIETIAHWRASLEGFIDVTQIQLENNVASILEKLVEPWKKTPLAEELPALVKEYIVQVVKKQKTKALGSLEDELVQPLTINDLAIEREQKNECMVFREARRKARAALQVDREEEKLGITSPAKTREDKVRKLMNSPNDLEPDEFQNEVEMMGRIRGYYNIASASFVDSICKSMRRGLFQETRFNLVNALETHFKLKDAEGFHHAKSLLEEDPSRAERRAWLLKELEKWEAAKASLDALITPGLGLEEVQGSEVS